MNRRSFITVTVGASAVLAAGAIAPLAGAAAAQNGDQQRVVTADRLNLRGGAGLGYRIVAVLEGGDIVSIAGGTTWADGYEWVQVAVWGSNLSGWVASQYLGTGGGDAPRDRVRVASGPLRVRSRPSLGGEVYYSAPVGAYGTVMDPDFVEADGYTWVYVQLDGNGVIGWMALEFLSYIDVA